jgi:hypothetical protein
MRPNNDHLKRESFFNISESILDDYKNLGYSYKNNLFRNSISSLYYLDERKIAILIEFEKMLFYLIERVKIIKKFRNFAVDKNSSNIN